MRDRLLEVAVGRGDHAHVDAERPARLADAVELAVLEHAQQLRLDASPAARRPRRGRACRRPPPGRARCGRRARRCRRPCSPPKSSASSRPSGSAAQFTLTSGRALRSERRCSAAATTSLPVPDSPRSSTLARERAMRGSLSTSARIAGLARDDALDARARPRRRRLAVAAARRREQRADQRAEVVLDRERLGQIVDGAALQRGARGVDRREGGHHHHLAARPDALRAPQQLEPVDRRHHEIGEQRRRKARARSARSAASGSER